MSTSLEPLSGFSGVGAKPTSNAELLPAWPLASLFGLFAVWWTLGLLDVILIPLAAIMTWYMMRSRGVRVPRSFALWLIFIMLAGASIVELDTAGQLVGYLYRYLVYLSSTVVFVYAYNARRHLTARNLCGLLTVVWLTTVLGGYLGVMFPGVVVRTPMSYITPGSLLSNDLVNHMVIRRFSQFNPDSYFELSPRPSAPFRFTNNWGNVYSVLLPVVIAYLYQVKGTRRYWWLLLVLPISAVPAFLTLNRGMLIGIGIAMVYVSIRTLLLGRPKFIIYMVVVTALGAALFSALPTSERIDSRLANEGSSNDTRASLYLQSIDSVKDSPFLGHGVPQEGENPNAPPVGTQGQIWMILVSHGPLALVTSMGWFLIACWQSRKRRDLVGLACHTSLLVATVELCYYGVLPYGLPLMMAVAALAMRPPDPGIDPRRLGHAAATLPG
ncbi:conserved membrane hypothetical protein [metagenome]|uniref:O-antigen ligase-related domain-containing protein n=1 Tax=metagenome TaxID=256318 RepID=A0A2P2BZF3_9ZZZZ